MNNTVYQEKLINSDGYYECVIDGRTFKTFPELSLHVVRKLKYKSVYDYMIEYKLDDVSNYIKCEICGSHVINMGMHIKSHKETNINEYQEKYGLQSKISNGLSKFYSKVKSGENNSFHKKNSSYEKRANRSFYKMEFYKKKYPDLSEDEIINIINEKKKKIGDILSKSNSYQYWVEKGYSEEEAKKMNSYRFCYGDLKKLTYVYGIDKAFITYSKRVKGNFNKLVDNHRIKPYYEYIISILNDKKIAYSLCDISYTDDYSGIVKHIMIKDNIYLVFSKKQNDYHISIYRDKNNELVETVYINEVSITKTAEIIEGYLC